MNVMDSVGWCEIRLSTDVQGNCRHMTGIELCNIVVDV